MKDVFQQIESQITSGQLRSAQAAIKQWVTQTRRKTPEELVRAAELSRRAGLFYLALRLLNPVVRPKQRNPVPASPQALTEYAASLIQIGAGKEAYGLLEAVRAEIVPQRDLFIAFKHFGEWDYRAALPHLEAYAVDKRLTDYQRRVGRLNLAATHVALAEYGRALAILEKLLKELPSDALLRANALEVQAQVLILSREYAGAQRSLAEAQKMSAAFGGTFDILISKWQAVLELRKSKGASSSLRKLEEFRALALRHQRWEVVRDCDYHKAQILQDLETARHLYFGTPYPSYRQRLVMEFGSSLAGQGHYAWSPLAASKKTPWLDVLTGENSSTEERLKAGQKPQRLLSVLSSDFYRPQRLGTVFANLYPEEHYSPEFSPQKTHQIILRLREWLSEQRLPLEVAVRRRSLELGFEAPLVLRVRAEIPSPEKAVLDSSLSRLEVGRRYSNKDLRSLLNLSARSVNRLLDLGLANGRFEKSGQGRSTLYKLLK